MRNKLDGSVDNKDWQHILTQSKLKSVYAIYYYIGVVHWTNI